MCMEFFKQEYLSELPCASPGDLPDLPLEFDLLHHRWILLSTESRGKAFRQMYRDTKAWLPSTGPGLPGGSVVKNLPANADVSSIPGSGKSPGVGNGNPLQYSCLENSMDRGAWWSKVHGVANESDTT